MTSGNMQNNFIRRRKADFLFGIILKIIQCDIIILELNDDAPESKLLGIQIDIDLEDKDKSSVDMK